MKQKIAHDKQTELNLSLTEERDVLGTTKEIQGFQNGGAITTQQTKTKT